MGHRQGRTDQPAQQRRTLQGPGACRFGDGRVRPNKKIDTTLSSVLFTLLGQPEGEAISLATRNPLRNLTMKVPSGQRVAQAMRLPELAASDLDDLPQELQGSQASERSPASGSAVASHRRLVQPH